MCRIFKKTIQIQTKPNEEEQAEDSKKEIMMQGEDSSGTEIMETMDEKVININNNEYPKFPCDASSSDVTQGTCTPTETCNNNNITDDFHAQFACDEANSSTISYPIGNLFQVTLF